MSKENEQQIALKIQRLLAEEISDELNLPVFIISQETTVQLFKWVKQIPEISKNFSDDELYMEVSSFSSKIIPVIRPKSEEEIKERVDEFLVSLKTEKNYEAVIVLPYITELPIGTRIGKLEIIEWNIDNEKLEEYLQYWGVERRIHFDKQSKGKILFKSYKNVDIRDVFYKYLELPFAILSLIFDLDIDVRDCMGMIKSTNVSTVDLLKPQKGTHGWVRYTPSYNDECLKVLTEISTDNKPSRLKQKVLQAIQIYGLSRLSHRLEIRFLFLIASFESLLLTENDRDYLGKKLAEKTAFLLETDCEKRMELYKLMKNRYRQRSDLIHKGKTDITQSIVIELSELFRVIVFRILKLSEKYTKMEQKSRDGDKEGIEDYINQLKFS